MFEINITWSYDNTGFFIVGLSLGVFLGLLFAALIVEHKEKTNQP